MATAEIRVGLAMGSGAPVYNPPRASATLTTTTTSAAASLTTFGGAYSIQDGDFVKVTARGSTSGQYVAISKSATTHPREYVAEGQSVDIGPLKAGDTINVADVA